IFGATNKDLCKSFEKLIKDKFQMSSMGELIYFLGLRVKQKKDGIFISQDKYVAEILNKFGLTEGKSASTPIDTEKPLLKDPNGEDVDVHIYRLQALVDKKKVLITEAAIRDILHLDDAEGVDCCPLKRFFLNWLAWVMRIRLQSLHSGNDNDAAQGADAAISGDDVQDQSIPSPTPPTPPPQPSQDIPSTSQVQSHSPQPQSPTSAQPHSANFPMSLLQEALDACAALTRRRVDTSDDTIMEDVSNQGRIIDKLDRDEGVVLIGEKEEEKKAEEVKDITGDAQVEGRQAEIYQIDIDHAVKVLSMQEDEPKVKELVEVVTTVKLITEVVTAASTPVSVASIIIPAAEPKVPAATITTDPVKVATASTRRRREVRYQVMKKRPQTEAQAQRNMIMYLKNTDGFRLDYFKGMSYDDIRPIFKAKFNSNIEFLLKSKEQIEEEENRALESINETPAQKAAKRRKMNEDVEDLKQHLEIVFRTTKDMCVDKELPEFKIRLYNNGNRMRYNALVSGSLGAIVYDSRPRSQNDFHIIIYIKDGVPQRISKLHPSCMALQFLLLFLFGEHGWSPEIKLMNNGSGGDKHLTINMIYSFQLHDRLNLYALLPRGHMLFQQYLVDAYISIEQNILDYIQSKQDMFRTGYLQGVYDALLKGDSDGHDVGKRIILPASSTDGPRYMYKHYEDALAICRVHGNPQYLMKSPKYPDMKSEDRPDIISKVFEMKIPHKLKVKQSFLLVVLDLIQEDGIYNDLVNLINLDEGASASVSMPAVYMFDKPLDDLDFNLETFYVD
nr:hypothetical protein [Tanacetum cinerariifolium]